jgi:hypothetical protein
VPRWVEAPPEPCRTGAIGPTLLRSTALLRASERARLAIAASSLGVEIRSGLHDLGANRLRDVSFQAIKGTLGETPVVAFWRSAEAGPKWEPGTTFALACPRAPSARHRTPDTAGPAWLYGATRASGRVCAVGVAGPTLDPKDQATSAGRDARARLAEVLAVHADEVILDDSDMGLVMEGSAVAPEWAVARAESAPVDQTWLDAEGLGPLGEAKLMYARACVAP